ncbi:hypothetical protein PVL29_009784 [Vitis rotundifolia]|uniref:Uncharacterized protein n=1 Tax=Vitis rotundifolia TaxID=103349 RepID=A0AA38ZT95_VITRO|nr:hypothetical protein PVL29_009784 [Vitis rotundifolia]
MASGQLLEELENKAREGKTVVPGGTGGKSLEAQEHLAEEQLGIGVQGVGEQRRADKEEADWDRRLPGDGAQRWAQHHGQVLRRACSRRRDLYR